ncbi:hypothetical protein PS2_037344 [Malus domestica]
MATAVRFSYLGLRVSNGSNVSLLDWLVGLAHTATKATFELILMLREVFGVLEMTYYGMEIKRRQVKSLCELWNGWKLFKNGIYLPRFQKLCRSNDVTNLRGDGSSATSMGRGMKERELEVLG